MNAPFDFDATLRGHHREALARLSPQLQAQLAQRRNAVLRGQPRASGHHRLRLAAAGFAALGALTLGLQFLPRSAHDGAPSAPTAALLPAAAPAQARGNGGSLPLEQDPDFYAWLGSNDAPQLAME